jgi:hypothetical protein
MSSISNLDLRYVQQPEERHLKCGPHHQSTALGSNQKSHGSNERKNYSWGNWQSRNALRNANNYCRRPERRPTCADRDLRPNPPHSHILHLHLPADPAQNPLPFRSSILSLQLFSFQSSIPRFIQWCRNGSDQRCHGADCSYKFAIWRSGRQRIWCI